MSAILTIDLEDKEAAAKLEKFFESFGRGAKKGKEETTSWSAAVTGFNQAWEFAEKIWGKLSQAIAFVGQAVDRVVIQTAAYDDGLGDMAEATGIAVQQLESLLFAGRSIGISNENMTVGLRTLTKAMEDGAKAGSPMAAEFANIGINVLDAGGKMKTAEQVMGEFADVFAKMENGAEKNALALKYFGKSGGDLVPLLNKSQSGVESLGGELERLGLASNDTAAALGGKLSDNLSLIQELLDALLRKLGRQLVPAFVEASDVALAFGKNLIQGIDWKQVVDLIGNIIQKAGVMASLFVNMAKVISMPISGIALGLGGILDLIYQILGFVPKAISAILAPLHDLANGLGMDGVAGTLKSVRDGLWEAGEALQITGDDAMAMGRAFQEGSDKALDVMGKSGMIIADLGTGIRETGASSEEATAKMDAGLEKAASTAEDVTIPAIEEISDTLEKTGRVADKCLGGDLPESARESAGAAKHVTSELDNILAAMEAGATTGVKVFEYGVPASLEKTETATKKAAKTMADFSLTAAMAIKKYSGPAVAEYFDGGFLQGKSSDIRFNGPLSQQANQWMAEDEMFATPSSFGGVSSGGVDPMLAAFARSGGAATAGAASDLISGRASSITGQKFNLFAENYPKMLAIEQANQKLAEDGVRKAQERIAQVSQSSVNNSTNGLRSIQAVHNQTATAANNVFGVAIPNAMRATTVATDAIIGRNRQVAESFRQAGSAAEAASAQMTGMGSMRSGAGGIQASPTLSQSQYVDSQLGSSRLVAVPAPPRHVPTSVGAAGIANTEILLRGMRDNQAMLDKVRMQQDRRSWLGVR